MKRMRGTSSLASSPHAKPPTRPIWRRTVLFGVTGIVVAATGCSLLVGEDLTGGASANDASLVDGSAEAANSIDSTAVDVGVDATNDGGVADPLVIHCGPASNCLAGPQTCCSIGALGNACRQATECVCLDAGTCPSGKTNLDCDDDGDCTPGQVCCGMSFPNDTYNFSKAICLGAANCDAVRLCDPTSPIARCPDGGSCVSLDRYARMGYCK